MRVGVMKDDERYPPFATPFILDTWGLYKRQSLIITDRLILMNHNRVSKARR